MAPDNQKEDWHQTFTTRNEKRLPSKLRDTLKAAKRRVEVELRSNSSGLMSHFLVELMGTHEFMWVKESDIIEAFDPEALDVNSPTVSYNRKQMSIAMKEGISALEEFECQLNNCCGENEEDESSLTFDVLCQDGAIERKWRMKQVKAILARNVIADFAWRCCEKQKATEVISTFIWKYHQEQKARKVIGNLIWSKIASQRLRRSRVSAISIQKIVRGVIVRGVYLKSLQPRLDAVRHFYDVWKETIEQVPPSVPSLTSWGLVRERLDLKRVDLLDEDGNLADTDEKLNQALSVALSEEDESEEIEDEEVEEALSSLTIEEDQVNVQESMIDWSQFQVSVHILCSSVCSVLLCAHDTLYTQPLLPSPYPHINIR